MAFTLPPLPYAYDALEPHIDARTMEIHYTKHHNAYLTNLNAAVANSEFEELSIGELLAKGAEKLSPAIRNNGGGYANHILFWEGMKASGGGEPGGDLAAGIQKAFGSFGEFKEKISTAAKTRFGSGWAWLVFTRDGKLDVYSTANQDSPVMQGDQPLLALDVWEHAYYLLYQNRRPDYVTAWWNVVNWAKVAENYDIVNR